MLPEHLGFPFNSKYNTRGLLVVRRCYEHILSIVNKRYADHDSGIIFSGTQGNGKVWLSSCLYSTFLFLIYIFISFNRLGAVS